jgi:hypothetical protein
MGLQKENLRVRANFTGVIAGLVAGSQFARLEKVITAKKSEGWSLAELIPMCRNLIVWVFQIIILILTLGLLRLSTGHILVFERQAVRRVGRTKMPTFRKEPTLTPRSATI